jgi:hypothetical protein
MEQVSLPQNLQGIHILNRPQTGKDGKLYFHNAKYIFSIAADMPKLFAGQGLRGIPNKITDFYAARDSTFWVIDDSMVYHFNYAKQAFTGKYCKINGDTIFPKINYFSCWNQYLIFSNGKGQFYCMDTTNKAPFLKVKLPAYDEGPYWVHSTDGGNVMLTTGKRWYLLQQNGVLKELIRFNDVEYARSVTLLKNGWLYVWTRKAELYAIQTQTLEVKKHTFPRLVLRPVGRIQFNGQEYAALGGPDSLYLFHPDSSNYFTWKNSARQDGHKIQPPFGLVYQEASGKVWIPNGKGLAHFYSPERITNPWFLSLTFLDTMKINNFQEPYCIQPSRYHPFVLFTSGNQLHITDTVKKQIVKTAKLEAFNSLTFTQLTELDAHKWIIAAKQGLFVFHIMENRFEPILYNGNPLRNALYSVFKDSIFVGEANDQLLAAPLHQIHELVVLTHFPKRIEYLKNFQDTELIAFTQFGLFRRHGNNPWEPITAANTISLKQLNSSAIGIHQANGELLIFAENTLVIINMHTWTLKNKLTFSSPDIPYSADKIIEIDKEHIGIIYRNAPLVIINIKNGLHYTLGMQQGWWGHNMGALSDIVKGNHSDWWATFDGGIVHYPQNWLLTPPAKPNMPIIENILIQFQPHPFPSSFYRYSPLEVSYKEGAISFDLGGYPKDSIEYSLPPYDVIWRKGTIATFTNLPGGTYTFKTRVAGAYGTYSPEKIMMIKILPPIWKTTWFRVLASFLLAVTAYCLFRWRLRIETTRQNRILQLAQSELKAIRSQMNPHFIFNCMAAIDGLIATGQSQKASAYLSKFSKLVRQVLQLSEKQLISLADEINTLHLYLQLEQLRMQDEFTYSITVEEGLEEQVEIPPMLLQPFVENSIIHGLKSSADHQKKILISVKRTHEKIRIIIEDNGIGRQEAAKKAGSNTHHQSMGTRLTTDRLKIMEQVLPIKTNFYYTDLVCTRGLASGTRVTIEIVNLNENL